MGKGICNHCGTAIPAGEAVVRSIAFERVSFHKSCWVESHQGIVSASREMVYA